jgi:hypothetical protein
MSVQAANTLKKHVNGAEVGHQEVGVNVETLL